MTFPTTIKEIKQGLAQGDFTSYELVKHLLEKSRQVDAKVESYLSFNDQAALEAASEADKRGYGSDAPILNGVPIAVKDNIVTKDLVTTAASKMLEDFVPTYDATAVKKLKEAGAVIMGKVNMDEFAMGASTERSAFKVTRNPWDLDRVPGGSSGGSAAVVASRQVPASLGSDTGGSIRQPAAFNGIVGLKPTYGTVSRYGLIAFGSSLDQIGPMTLTVEDNALLLDVLAGTDVHDSTTLPNLPGKYGAKIGQSLKGMKIAFPVEYKSEAIAAEIRQAMEKAADYFVSQGAIVEEVSLPLIRYGINVYYIISSAEASSNLQRFDGVRYGYRSASAQTLEDVYVKSRSEGFGDEVKRRIMLGTYSLSAGQFDKFFKQAAQVRTMIKNDFDKVFSEYQVIMGPTTTSTAFKIGEKTSDPIAMYVEDLLTVTANIAGLPGISVPAGFDQAGLPIGLQLMAKPLDEATLYQVAYQFEQDHDYVNQAPTL